MPVLIAIVVVSFVVGLVARASTARAVSIALAIFANAAFVWAIADDKGDDPAWLLVLSIVVGFLAIGAAHVGGRLRAQRVERAGVH